MTVNFNQWEADPFFSAAEDVQDSDDRLESTYRRWVHAQTVVELDQDVSLEGGEELADVLKWELRTTLGTNKGELDEFDRAVKSSYCGKDGDG